MYAIIEDSGTQIKVSQGDVIEIDHREHDGKANLVFDKVLAIGDADSDDAAKVGRPYLGRCGPTVVLGHAVPLRQVQPLRAACMQASAALFAEANCS